MPPLTSILSHWWADPAILTICGFLYTCWIVWLERHDEIRLDLIYFFLCVLLHALLWAGYVIVHLLSQLGGRT